jgi:hypothetical protein
MLTGNRRSLFLASGTDQGPQSGKDAEHVIRGRVFGQVTGSMVEQKIDFLREGNGLQNCMVYRHVGCPHNDTIMPWYGEEDATIGGTGHHDGTVTGQERLIQNDM